MNPSRTHGTPITIKPLVQYRSLILTLGTPYQDIKVLYCLNCIGEGDQIADPMNLFSFIKVTETTTL